MSQFRITTRYAKALLDLSSEKNALEEVRNDAEFIVNTCSESRDLVIMLQNPIVYSYKKMAVLKSIFENKISAMSFKFIEVSVRKNRAGMIEAIFSMFLEHYKAKHKISDATLITAVESSDATQKRTIDLLEGSTGEKIILSKKVDENLIGGFKILYKDKLLDASVASKLNELRKELID